MKYFIAGSAARTAAELVGVHRDLPPENRSL